MKKPNIILFITDQHRADHLGSYGNTVLKTPCLDAIASRGWRADRFYVASPVCMPNRSSLITGRMPSVHGARHNGIPLSLQSQTFVDLLRNVGYQTALVGKSHLQNMSGLAPRWPLPGAQETRGEALKTLPGNYDQEWGPLWRSNPDQDIETPFYGFSRVVLAVDHGDQVWGHYWNWLQTNHPEVAKLAGPNHATPAPDYELTQIKQAWRTRVPEELSSTAYIGEQTSKLVKEYADKAQPFFIMCSFPDPHHPFTPHGKYWDMYDPASVDLPASYHESKQYPLQAGVAWLYEQRDRGIAIKSTPAMFACSEREAREAIALNYGSISHIDATIGKVTEALSKHGVADDTILIFMSDHGDYLGDHQLLLKGPIHFQSLIRTPFIWMDPQKPVQNPVSDALASTIDVAPTILDRLGITPYNGIQGKSLLPLMTGRAQELHDAVLIEEETQRVMFGIDSRVRMRTMIHGNFRLSLYEHDGMGELYDLNSDPHELNNLWDSPSLLNVKQELIHRLVRTMIAHSETSPNPTALA